MIKPTTAINPHKALIVRFPVQFVLNDWFVTYN
jgi:hypothetical protein